MENKLNPKKVVEAIDSLLCKINKCLEDKKEFEDIHKESLRLCQIIFSKKKDYKIIDVPYPTSVVIVFDDSFGNETGKDIENPDEKSRWEQRKELAAKITSILKEAQELYGLKLKLSMDN